MVAPSSEEGAPQARHSAAAPSDGRGRTRTLGVLVAVMVVAGVVALVMTLFGNDSNDSRAASQPSESQVGQTRSAAPTSAATSSAGSTSTTSTPVLSTPTVPASSTPSPAVASTSTAKTTAKTKAKTATKVVKYKVKPGDNLTLIAKWFHQRGYGLVYNWNKSVIGKNPDLIHPGQTIIVSLKGNKMNVSAATK